MRRSALAPQSFAALAGVTEQLETQNVSEGNYSVYTSIFSHIFQTYTEKGYVSILIALLEANGFCSFMQDVAAEILCPSSL